HRARALGRLHLAAEFSDPGRSGAARRTLGAGPAQVRRRVRGPAVAAPGPASQRFEGPALPPHSQARARPPGLMARQPSSRSPAPGLTVAVTGATGDIGRSLLRSLDSHRDVRRVVAMARRAFDPSEHALRRTEYRRGNVLDPADVGALVKGADVVVHLAFVIVGDHDETTRVNLDGTRSVFE